MCFTGFGKGNGLLEDSDYVHLSYNVIHLKRVCWDVKDDYFPLIKTKSHGSRDGHLAT